MAAPSSHTPIIALGLIAAPGFATELAVYPGPAVSSLSRVASSTTSVRFKAKPGTVYRIAVDGTGGASGAVVLSLCRRSTGAGPPSRPGAVDRRPTGSQRG